MKGDLLPLVSCIMPTAGRRQWVQQAIRYFLRQDYANRELVILDDGAAEVVIPPDPRIRYQRLSNTCTLGAKRNLCVEASRGELILHWDDDDWFAAHRISYQVDALLRAGAEICGLSRMLFHEPLTGRTWLYEYPMSHTRRWLAGGSLLYTKHFWSQDPFPDKQVASDTSFIWGHALDDAVTLEDYEIYVAMIHPRNTSPKLVHEPSWTPWLGDLRRILSDDFDFYDFVRPGGKRDAPVGATSAAMRIGYVINRLLPLPESVRGELLALCDAGHEVFVYTATLDSDERVALPLCSGLTIRGIDCTASIVPLLEAARVDRIQHVHGSLMRWAQSAARTTAEALGIPFTIGVSNETRLLADGGEPAYGAIASSPSCAAVVAEDALVEEWLSSQCGIDCRRIRILSTLRNLDLPREPDVDIAGDAARMSELFDPQPSRADNDVPGLIDVIVPNYACAEYLGHCIESVAAQTYNFVRVTVVDDGSPDCDAARTTAAGFESRLPIRFLAHPTNRGAPAARNRGAKNADGEYLFFLDADCVLRPDALRTLIEALLVTPAASYAYGGFLSGNRLNPGQPFDGDVLLSRNYISTMSLIRRKAFPQFDESLKRLQDWDLWLTMMREGSSGVWCDEVLFETPMREHSISSGTYSWSEAVAVLRRKHGGLFDCRT
jgi:glycosyltransferase involved in cell wall biosynthesis